MNHEVLLSIPAELAKEATALTAADTDARMRAVISWSRQNVQRGEGPFAAGVFDLDTGECLGAGVNRVLSSGCSVAHAEIMAILMAQSHTGHIHLSTDRRVVLTSSAQPCSQCMGAIPWAGIVCLEYGADREAVEAIGFDEGPYPDNWIAEYEQRGIQVHGPLMQEEAVGVIRDYAAQDGTIY